MTNSYYSHYGVSGCRVVQGVINGLHSPACTPSGTTFFIGKFSEIILNKRLNAYRIKLEIFHSGWTNNLCGSVSCFTWAANVLMWAGMLARANNWYVFYSSLSGVNSYFSYYSNQFDISCWSGLNPYPVIVPYRYNYFNAA